jgi:serine phosphatase RsbU (regulator of sigma subunit)
MLPQPEQFAAHFPDHFVMYIPRDGVSGDFFWLEAQEGRVLVAAADCTGHGVPGALMSMLGYSLLKQIVNERGYARPDKVLTLLDHYTREVLCRTNHPQQVNDGMDIGLLAFNPQTYEVEFAGAYNPLYHVHQGTLVEIKANRQAIGGKLEGRLKTFDLQVIQAQPGDALYLFSDGFADQFGRQGERNKKFGPQRLRSLLAEMHPLPMAQQRARLVQEFMTWKGSLPQMDDVLVMGLRV